MVESVPGDAAGDKAHRPLGAAGTGGVAAGITCRDRRADTGPHRGGSAHVTGGERPLA